MCMCVACPNLCYPTDCSPPGSSVHRISQATILEWVAISFFKESSQIRNLASPALVGKFQRCCHLGKPLKLILEKSGVSCTSSRSFRNYWPYYTYSYLKVSIWRLWDSTVIRNFRVTEQQQIWIGYNNIDSQNLNVSLVVLCCYTK